MNAQARTCAPAKRGFTFPAVAKGCLRSSKDTPSKDCPIPRLFWTRPHQSPLPSALPDCDPSLLGPLPPVRPVLDAELRSQLLGGGLVPALHFSRGSQPHKERGEHMAHLLTWETYRTRPR